MIIEKLNEAHLKACAKIYVETFNEAPWNDKWDERSAYNRLNEIYNTPRFIGMVALEKNQVTGCIFGVLETWFEGNMYNLKEMFVMKESKGTGIGSTMMKTLSKELEDHHVHTITLFTSKGDLTEKFYLNNGFISEEDMVMMCKSL